MIDACAAVFDWAKDKTRRERRARRSIRPISEGMQKAFTVGRNLYSP
jgi:hypothetical protein